ncbi:MAG: aminomethyl-transferring glycine dehydrogenase subunit GcvPA, partial [Rikenellaceae bacterium]|nr:aminomethyl-transferring glycine dehydrogenase subunit GcvPA [Rikenellaceae bacterium]
MQDKFMDRHIGPSQKEIDQMLETIGVKSVEELISQVVPQTIRLEKDLELPAGMSEYEFLAHVKALAAKNKPFRTFIGMGYYGTAAPAAIIRNILENPAWYTSYTPYQAEISQGRLEALLNFQTVIISLTGMEISNCSLLDEATSAAEAMFMMYSQRSRAAVKEGRNLLFVDEKVFPQTLDLLMTRSEPRNIELAVGSFKDYEFTGREFGAILQYPNAAGEIEDYAEFTQKAHERDILVTADVDLLALTILKSPAEWGADIVIGSTQRFGLPMGFGGPHAGFLATKDAYKRVMPGRIIGVSVDRLGNKALRMALQTREQHIKREKATSNICTSQALMATMTGMYAVYHGPEGLRRIATHAHSCAVAVADALRKLGYNVLNNNIFDTFEVECDSEKIRTIALRNQINLYYPNAEKVHMSFDEVTTVEEVNTVIAIFAEAAGKEAIVLNDVEEKIYFAENFVRNTPFLEEPLFNKYHNESDLMRYIKKLERRDISLADSMIPLGSCTMKLNAAAMMMPVTYAEFGNIHPFVPAEQAQGSLEMILSFMEKESLSIRSRIMRILGHDLD